MVGRATARGCLLAAGLLAGVAVVAGGIAPAATAAEPKGATKAAAPAAGTKPERRIEIKFPDFGYMVPPGQYDGRVFALAQNYPKELPPVDAEAQAILKMDFRKDWRAYMKAVHAYIMQGNIDAPGYENDFFLEDNRVRRWFHVPWQHWGASGREGYHGLTQEGPISPGMLAPSQTSKSHAYAVGFYNAQGGYAIGQVWPSAAGPNLAYFENNKGFPDGTIVGKLLFTTLDEKEVPYLANPIEWDAYVYASDVPGQTPSTPDQRMTAKVRLIQMDIMVRDSRLDDVGGWVFGTFVYNGALNNANRWDNLVPVGVMWGNDPDVRISLYNPTPTETKTNPALKQTIINEDRKQLPATHLGWGYRLNGPVDNPLSSCMSCHSTAQYPAISAIMPFLNNPPVPVPANSTPQQPVMADDAWMRWFRNLPWGEAFDGNQNAVNLDFSLQLQKSIINWIDYLNTTQQGQFAGEYWSTDHKVSRGAPLN